MSSANSGKALYQFGWLLVCTVMFWSSIGSTPIQARPAISEVESTFEANAAFLQGLEIASYLAREYELVEDENIVQRLNDIGYAVSYWASSPDIVYSYNVVKMKEPNAFALPGGFIFVTEGMLKIDLSDDELAMLLGHETAHVKLNHLAKMQRRSGLLAMLQQILLIGTVVGMQNSGTSYRGPVDPRRDPVEISPSGKWAVVQGLATFGTLFRNMLELGYSRKFEFEADHHGYLYATHAGYKNSALESLMQKLHDHIYETPGIGYWRTHPYFNERIERAHSKSGDEQPERKISNEVFYRRRIQADMIKASLELNKDDTFFVEKRMFLDQLSFQALPEGHNTDLILYNMLTSKRLMEQKNPSGLRDYGQLLKMYDRALKLIEKHHRESPQRETILKERADLDQERTESLPRFLGILDREEIQMPLLKTFLSNYPDHPRVPEVQVRLAENYRLSDEIKEAAILLLKVKSLETDSEWKNKADEQLQLLFPLIKDPSLCCELIQEAGHEEQDTLEKVMDTIIDEHLTFENISTFFEQWSQSEYIEPIKKQWDSIAQREYNRGRILEAAGEFQKALDAYNSVITYAGQIEPGLLSQQRIDIIQSRTP
ncbi:M48 family metalloprotease [bacterium]|nr:M48 family metalloprotease [bacterium]